MELDLTKSMRVRLDADDISAPFLGRQVWPTNRPTDIYGALCVIVDGYDKWHVIRKHDLENIPEPVKHEVYLRAEPNGSRVSLIYCAPGHKATPNLAKLTVWRDEEGKTRVEIPKEESCK